MSYLPKLNQDQTSYLNRCIATSKIKAVIKCIPNKTKQNKNPGSDGFRTEFCRTFKEELIPILLKLPHKPEAEGTLPNTLYETTVALIPKPYKKPVKKYR